MILKDSANIKEQCSSNLIVESLFFTCITEWLAWKSCRKYIKWRNVFGLNFLYVTFWNFTKICLISFLCELIIIR